MSFATRKMLKKDKNRNQQNTVTVRFLERFTHHIDKKAATAADTVSH